MKNINKIKPDKNKNPDTSNQEGNLAKTVCGFIESKNLGNVLHNEHILFDQSTLLKKTTQPQSNKKEFNTALTPENAWMDKTSWRAKYK